MRITLFSFVITMLWSVILAAIIHVCRKKPQFIRRFGTKKLLFLCFLSLVRMMLPYEFSFARALPFVRAFPSIGAFPSGGFCGIGTGIPIHKADAGQPLFLWILALVWGGVSAVLLIRFFCRYIWSMQRCSRYGVCEEKLCQQVFQRILNESGRQMEITVRRSGDASVPMGVGILKKSILLPEEDYSPSELYYILLHEFTHFKNRDLLVKAVVHILSCIYWWNPAVYLMEKDIAQILEMQCDLDVTDSIKGRDKANYLAVIVSVLKNASVRRQGKEFYGTAALVVGGYGAETLERFQVVSMDPVGKRKNKLVTASWILALALLFGASYSFAAHPGHEGPRGNHAAEAGLGAYGVMEGDSFVDVMKNAESAYMYLHGSYPH